MVSKLLILIIAYILYVVGIVMLRSVYSLFGIHASWESALY